MEQISTYLDQLTQLAVNYSPTLLLASLVFFIGWWIANRLSGIIINVLNQSNAGNRELRSFLGSIVGIGLKILVVLSVAGIVGIETTSFVGIIAAMGFAIGLALQGNLSNFAAGVLILLMRPFKIGDEVKIEGYWAFVRDIQIFHTVLENFDKTKVILPNSIITGGVVENLSASVNRDVCITLNIPYSEDLNKVEQLIVDAAFSVPEVIQSEKPFFWVMSYETHFIQALSAFTTTYEGFWDTQLAVNKAVIETLKINKIQVAYPTGVTFGVHGFKRPDRPSAASGYESKQNKQL